MEEKDEIEYSPEAVSSYDYDDHITIIDGTKLDYSEKNLILSEHEPYNAYHQYRVDNVYYLDSPLIEHKINMLRDVQTHTPAFRRIVKEVSMLEGYEVLRDIKMVEREIETPIEKMTARFIDNHSLCFVPILRAGMGMVDGFSELVPNVAVGHIGLYRDEVTKQPHAYYCKLPDNLEKKKVILLDPMLATGGSSIDAVKTLKENGAKDIVFVCIIAAPEGIEAFTKAYPDIPLYVGALDRELNSDAYICPGLGDCGDRIFGTIKEYPN